MNSDEYNRNRQIEIAYVFQNNRHGTYVVTNATSSAFRLPSKYFILTNIAFRDIWVYKNINLYRILQCSRFRLQRHTLGIILHIIFNFVFKYSQCT